jgi:hypothetical protein
VFSEADDYYVHFVTQDETRSVYGTWHVRDNCQGESRG